MKQKLIYLDRSPNGVKHGGGNIMIWFCYSRYVVGPIHQITDTMTRFHNKDILEIQY